MPQVSAQGGSVEAGGGGGHGDEVVAGGQASLAGQCRHLISQPAPETVAYDSRTDPPTDGKGHTGRSHCWFPPRRDESHRHGTAPVPRAARLARTSQRGERSGAAHPPHMAQGRLSISGRL